MHGEKAKAENAAKNISIASQRGLLKMKFWTNIYTE